MSPISPADTNLVPRREFIRDQRPSSSFSILALSGTALLRLYNFPADAAFALRKHLDNANLILSSRELIQDNFCELTLDGKPWSSPKSTRAEKLLIEIIDVIHRTGHNLLSTLDYGREQDDRIVMAFSRTSSPPPLSGATSSTPFQSISNDSLGTVPNPAVKIIFAISFISQNHLRVIGPPLHLTPAILRTVRGSWPRGAVSEKKAADNVYEFKLKGYRWFQENTFATDSLRQILSLLSTLDGFGFTLLTSLTLNNRSRSKDLWVFTGVSQTIPPESQSSSPLGSRTDLQAISTSDIARERRRSYLAPANSSTANNRPSHSRAATESSIGLSSHNPSSVLISSGLVRKPAPRAQLPVSVAHSTASNDNAHDRALPPVDSTSSEELRMELQSSVGSAEDMTGVGTQKYGRPGEPDVSPYQQTPSKFYNTSPSVAKSYYPSMSASMMKASQLSALPRGFKTSGRTEVPSPAQETAASSIPLRSRHSPVKGTSQPVTPLLSPGAFRDSALSSNTGQTVDMPSTWPGAGRENGLSGGDVLSREPKESMLPGGWKPPSAETKETKISAGHPEELDTHSHALRSLPNPKPEEQEVKVSVPELVRPRHRLARSGEATLFTEAPRADIHRTKGVDRLAPPPRSTPNKRENDPSKPPPEGWVLVSVGQPSKNSSPPAPKSTSTSQPGLRRKQSFPPTASQKPPLARSPYTTGPQEAPPPSGSPVGSGRHKKAPSNPNPSSMSPAAKAIVIIDAMQAKRKATSGDTSQSSFRKFFNLSRPGSPKPPSKEPRTISPSGGGKAKFVEPDNLKKREGSRERWRVRGMPEVTNGNRRMSVD
ncbi:hypothetical protein F5148DRAFT_1279309 [Russula earlei]|uniref:Uncharacterized protein n=1 Tax=Russula earlei TaxID=71964 RepID=A0ACC0UM86_9AGAM|nr:hypothetical protein F5148DRAFT_1279309 [Russula earlei]